MSENERQGTTPSDSEELMGDTASSDSLTQKKGVQPAENASREENASVQPKREKPSDDADGETYAVGG